MLVTSGEMFSNLPKNLHEEGLAPTCERMSTYSKDLNLDMFLFYCTHRSDQWTNLHLTLPKSLSLTLQTQHLQQHQLALEIWSLGSLDAMDHPVGVTDHSGGMELQDTGRKDSFSSRDAYTLSTPGTEVARHFRGL